MEVIVGWGVCALGSSSKIRIGLRSFRVWGLGLQSELVVEAVELSRPWRPQQSPRA